MTEEEKQYEAAVNEIIKMKTEAEKHNTPDGFGMYGKLRRKISKNEKDLPELKRKAEKSRLMQP